MVVSPLLALMMRMVGVNSAAWSAACNVQGMLFSSPEYIKFKVRGDRFNIHEIGSKDKNEEAT